MASSLSDDIRYVKLFLLLVKGGTFTAKRLILKISNSANKSIGKYLKDNQDKLESARKKNHISQTQIKVLFPSSPLKTNLEDWDITLLSYVLLNLFDYELESHEKTAINELRVKRNELQGHPASTNMSEVHFLREWCHLTVVLSQLTKGLTTAEQHELNDTVVNILKIEDFYFATTELKPFEGSDEFVHEVVTDRLQCYEQRLNDCNKKVNALTASHDEMKQQQDILVRIVTKCEAAQRELLQKLQKIIPCEQHETGDQDDTVEQNQTEKPNQTDQQNQSGDEVLTASQNLVSDMKAKGVDIVKVEKGSILVTFRCSTISDLKNINQYFAHRMYNERLKELENALSKYLGSPVEFNIYIVLETLYSALEQIEKDAHNKSIVLTLQCRSPEGVKNAQDCFGNGSSTNALNPLSEALSRSVGQRVELHTTINVDKLENDITEREQHLTCGDQNSKELERRGSSAESDVDEYRNALQINKVLVQNANDAGASEMNIPYINEAQNQSQNILEAGIEEPEAAAISCMYTPEQMRESMNKFGDKGQRFLVADLGGGTADLSAGEVDNSGNLKELCEPSGRCVVYRISRGTYGVATYAPYDETKHDLSKKWKNKETGNFHCKDIFDIHIQKGQSVRLSATQPRQTYTPMYKEQKAVRLTIFSSSSDNPKYTTENSCERIGEFTVDMPDSTGKTSTNVEVTMIYGETGISVIATEKTTGDMCTLNLNLNVV